jgi:RND family efflux transporter MFP subunit
MMGSGKNKQLMSVQLPALNKSEAVVHTVRQWALIAVMTSASALVIGQPASAQQATPVVVGRAEMRPMLEQLPLTGSVSARRTSHLSPRVDGLVTELLVDDGDFVEKDQVLVKLDPVLSEVQLARSSAALQEARARLADARRRRDESAELASDKLVASTVYDSAVAEVEINEASVKRLEAEFRQQEELLDRHSIRAPFDGVVGRKEVEIGQWVQRGAAVMDVFESSVLRIEVPVPQIHFNRVTAGTPAIVRFDSNPGDAVDASVKIKIPLSNPAARTFPVRIEIDNADGIWAPGMSARITLLLSNGNESPVMQVHRDALTTTPDGTNIVWIVDGNPETVMATPVEVRTGRALGEMVEVVGGDLPEGARVIIRGNERLRPGQSIRIIDEQA